LALIDVNEWGFNVVAKGVCGDRHVQHGEFELSYWYSVLTNCWWGFR